MFRWREVLRTLLVTDLFSLIRSATRAMEEQPISTEAPAEGPVTSTPVIGRIAGQEDPDRENKRKKIKSFRRFIGKPASTEKPSSEGFSSKKSEKN